MQVAEAIVRILEKEGIEHAFGIPGASINPVYKYLEGSLIKHHLMRHEEAAVHAADGYYRSSSRIALAICTSGPAATNFLTGLYTASIDSIPLIAITGQAKANQLGTDAFQCIDIVSMAKPVVKKAVCVLDPENIVEILKDAVWTAKEGRPGPVLLDLPLDVQMKDVHVDLDSYKSLPIERKSPNTQLLQEAVTLLDNAKNPIIIAGGGVVLSHAEEELLKFAEWMQIPVITTYMAKGLIPEDHYLNAGMVGIQVGASSSGNAIFLDSDVVLGIGCRFTDRHTGALDVYKGERKFIHIDVDPKEIGKLIKPEIGIESDALEALKAMLEIVRAQGKRAGSQRVKQIAPMKEQSSLKTTFEGESIDPKNIFAMVDEVFSDNALFTTGCGLVQIWSGQYQKINKPRVYLPSGGAGTLGFDIPAAIGASVGANNKKTVCMMGDFGFTFLVEELGVASKYHIPIVVIIMNNGYLSLIRQNQKYAYKYEHEVSMEENLDNIDYVKISEGFGCESERVASYNDLKEALLKAKKASGPYVIDVIVDREVDCNMGNDLTHIATFN
ncbi:thiamine pyrophosphate-dependent enzyme [uncultured Sphaerochaeta sp.]|uniref:thiamine pyrophosphate-dependent enzyme n=1 Tax=uncultured Sphaerochaeta sp. TaxID=886478 RepID=UPI002A0A619A|nr:thiamine pyrophosphate-dependent enzyme [uncultured Sphaerochaeta sp.]